MVVSEKEASVLDRLLKRYLWGELLLGILLVAASFFFNGVILLALGGCVMGFAAQCSAHSKGCMSAAVALGIVSLGVLVLSCVQSFFSVTSLSGYNTSASPLSVLLVLAALFLLQSFLSLPVEDRGDLDLLRRGIRVQTVFAALGLLGVFLNYLLSYFFLDSFLSNLLEQDKYYSSEGGSAPAALQDFHYIEGVIALALCITAIRSVVRAFMGKEPLSEAEKETVE